MYLYLGTSYMYCSSTAVGVAHVLAAPLQPNQQMVWITTCGIPHTAYMVCSCLFVIFSAVAKSRKRKPAKNLVAGHLCCRDTPRVV